MKSLMESAAEMLTKSKSAAPEMPVEKPKEDAEDLGGVTPEKDEPESDISAKNVKQVEKPKAKATIAEADEDEKDDEDEDEDEDEKDEEDEYEKKKEEKDMKESTEVDVTAILSDETNLSEEFRSKITTIYEARLSDRVGQIREQMESEYIIKLSEAVTKIETDLTENIDAFLNCVVEEWMEKNQVAVEKGLRTELVEDFIGGLRNLFAEHYITVPDEKIDLVDELAEKVETLEKELNETVARNVEMKKRLVEQKKQSIIATVCEGLTQTQTEKIRSLVEGAEYTADGDFQKKVETIKENYFPKTVKMTQPEQLIEQGEVTDKPEIADPVMRAYSQAISKIAIK